MPDHRHRPTLVEKRAKKQLADLNAAASKTIKELDKHPDDYRRNIILHQHEARVAEILQRGRKQPKPQPLCSICGKPLPQSSELWTDSLPLKILYSFAVACLFGLFGWLFEWWALLLFPVGWAVSQSFLWTITVPFLMLLIFMLLLSPFGM